MNVIITFTLLSAILLPFFQVRSQASNWYDSNWLYRQKLTVQSSKVPNTDQANFPVYVDLSDMKSGFFSNVKSDGSDLVVTSSDGTTKLDRELVSINTGSSSGELWFKAPNLSNTANTVFYIYYGNSSASETNSTNVWSNGYEIVQHMSEDPSASAPQMQDSTSNNHDGTASGSMSTGNRVAAKIGNGYDLNGSGNYINFGDNNSFSFINGSSDSDFMLSGWIRIDAFGPNAYGSSFIGKMDSAGKDYEYNLFLRHDVN